MTNKSVLGRCVECGMIQSLLTDEQREDLDVDEQVCYRRGRRCGPVRALDHFEIMDLLGEIAGNSTRIALVRDDEGGGTISA